MSERMSACPSPDAWDRLAAGLIRGPEADALIEHASWCRECALRLADSLEIFRAEPEVAPLPAPMPLPKRSGFLTWGAIAAAVAVAAGLAWWSTRPPHPLTQLAGAYAQHRSWEFRIPGAGYSPHRAPRAGGASLADRPPEVLAAAARINAELNAHPREAAWVHARGRLALIEGRPDDAIEALKMARDLGAPAAEASVDLASAYYLRALKRGESGAGDLTMSQDILGEILQRDPANAVALFNRALVSTELHQLTQAVADWEKFLQSERDPAWRREAEQRLAEVRRKLQAFLERPPGQDEQRFAEVALDSVLRHRLQHGEALAMLLQTHHGDPWLSELLALPRTPANQAAVQALAGLADIRLTAQRGRYRQERHSVSAMEAAALAEPLAAWRAYELAYRSTHTAGEFRCQRAAIPPRYRWLHAHAAREAASCAVAEGQPDEAWANVVRSRDEAQAAGLAVAEARAEALLGSLEHAQGLYREALSRQRLLLGKMLQQGLPLSRSHEPIHTMMLCARSMERYHAARNAAAMAVQLARAAGFQNAEFTDLVQSAAFALRTQDRAAAANLYREAVSLYAASGGKAAPPLARAWAETVMVEATGEWSRLAAYQSLLEGSQELSSRTLYQRLQARRLIQTGADGPAENRLQKALDWLLAASADVRHSFRQEATLCANDLLELLLRQHRAADALALVQRLLHRDETVMRSGPERRIAASPHVLFSLRAVGERIVIFRQDTQGVTSRWSDWSARETNRRLRLLLAASASPRSSAIAIRQDAAAFTNALFRTWLAEVPPGQEIFFQAEGWLASIPFPLLKGARQEVGRERMITMTSSAVERTGTILSRPGSALFVDATRSPGLSPHGLAPLPPPDQEEAALAQVTSRMRRLRGSGALRAGLRQAMPAVDLLHFAGHAVRRGDAIGLAMEDGVLDLKNAVAPPRVVLSACSTSHLHQDEEDTVGAASLAHAFLLAGAAEVVGSAWDLDSRAAGLLMDRLYREWAGGRSLAEALRASVNALADSPEFAHPYYWAGAVRLARI